MFKSFSILRFGRIAIVAGLAIGMLVFSAANSWAVELVGFNNYTLYKFCEDEVAPWTQKIQGTGMVKYECDDAASGCFIVVDAIGICGNTQDLRYTCDDGAEVTLLPSGVLLIPEDCTGVCTVTPCPPS